MGFDAVWSSIRRRDGALNRDAAFSTDEDSGTPRIDALNVDFSIGLPDPDDSQSDLRLADRGLLQGFMR